VSGGDIRRRVLRPFFASLCGVLIALPVVIVAFDQNRSVTEQEWFDRVSVCKPQSGDSYAREQTFNCLEKVVVSAAKDDALMTVASAITDVASEDVLFYGFCHAATHRIGKDLLELYGSAEEALRAASTIDCGNGLAHGILDYWAAESSTELSSFPDVVAACEEAEIVRPGGCAEGVGHAAYQHQEESVEFNSRLDTAFKICEQFSIGSQGIHCGYGVLMQPYLKQNDFTINEAELIIPKNGELIEICKKLDHRDDVVDGCFQGAGWLMGVGLMRRSEAGDFGSLSSNDSEQQNEAIFSQVIEDSGYCASMTPDYTRGALCLTQYFARLPLTWYTNTGLLEKRCARLPKKNSVDISKFCFAGSYEFTPPKEMLALMRRHPEIVELVRVRWVRERGDELLAEFKKTTAPKN